VQKVHAGMLSAAALEAVFRHPPPSGRTKSPARDKCYMPRDWELIIEAARDKGLLTLKAAERWSRYISETVYQEYWWKRKLERGRFCSE